MGLEYIDMTNGAADDGVRNRPETFDAWLQCEGRCRRPTLHSYSVSRLAERRVETRLMVGVEHWFVCAGCGVERVWGFE